MRTVRRLAPKARMAFKGLNQYVWLHFPGTWSLCVMLVLCSALSWLNGWNFNTWCGEESFLSTSPISFFRLFVLRTDFSFCVTIVWLGCMGFFMEEHMGTPFFILLVLLLAFTTIGIRRAVFVVLNRSVPDFFICSTGFRDVLSSLWTIFLMTNEDLDALIPPRSKVLRWLRYLMPLLFVVAAMIQGGNEWFYWCPEMCIILVAYSLVITGHQLHWGAFRQKTLIEYNRFVCAPLMPL